MRTGELKALACAAVAMLLGHASLARASEVSISLSTAITGLPGDTITVFGNLTNDTANTLYFGNDAINLAAPSTVATAADDIILDGLLGTGPTSLAAGATLDDVDLFSVQLLTAPAAFGGNSFTLFGGTDAAGCSSGASDCTAELGSTGFSVNISSPPVPLPAAGWLLLSGMGGLLGVSKMRRGQTIMTFA